MPEPFGNCDQFNNKSMSDCRLDCRTREIIKRCNCRDVYMKNLTFSEYARTIEKKRLSVTIKFTTMLPTKDPLYGAPKHQSGSCTLLARFTLCYRRPR